MTKTQIYCTGQLEGGTSFAIREDTGESVYIPAAVASRANVHIGSGHMAILIPNAREPDRTPWFAVFVDPAEAEPAVDIHPPEDELLVQVERLLLRTRGYFTTEEVADACDVDPVEAQAKLDNLFSGGHIRRAVVQKVPNGDVELTLWAMNVSDFLAEDE